MTSDDASESLGQGGRALWESITRNLELRPDERALLKEAARTQDVVDALSAALDEHGPMTEGSKGQLRVSPIVGELRQQRLTLVRLLGALGIPESDDEARPVTTTTRARKAAAARWAGRHG
ncbi:hypothetical protein ABZ370_38560 [Streptomyces sp. NPDC005962]|uniref:hypothetical protein n=1 Tax=Streptomyces sp. NPDC005962 TaxID=3154466 RepID=UPI0033DB0428